jgi:hypothetical protein
MPDFPPSVFSRNEATANASSEFSFTKLTNLEIRSSWKWTRVISNRQKDRGGGNHAVSIASILSSSDMSWGFFSGPALSPAQMSVSTDRVLEKVFALQVLALCENWFGVKSETNYQIGCDSSPILQHVFCCQIRPNSPAASLLSQTSSDISRSSVLHCPSYDSHVS